MNSIQPRPAEAPVNHTFQFSKCPCALSCLHELDYIRTPIAASSAAITASNGLEDVTLNRSISTFLIVMLFSFHLRIRPYALKNASRSSLIRSLRVVHMPCGAPLWIFSVASLTSLDESMAEAPIGTI